MESILNKSIGMYHKIMGKLSPEKSRAAILALFGMVLGTILSKFNNMSTLKLSRDEQTQLKDKIKSKSTTIESNDETIKSNDETIKSNDETIKSQPTEEEANAELTSIKRENKRLESENANYESQLAENQKTLDALTAEAGDIDDQQNAIKDSITSIATSGASSHAKQAREIEELEDQIKSITDIPEISQDVKNTSGKPLKTTEELITSQNQILEEEDLAVDSLQREHIQMIADIHEYNNRASELEHIVENVAEEREQKQKTIENLKKQIHALETRQTTNKEETGK